MAQAVGTGTFGILIVRRKSLRLSSRRLAPSAPWTSGGLAPWMDELIELGMSRPLAYFLTWTCHGTWLQGDKRGWVNHDHNQYGTNTLAPSDKLQRQTLEAIGHAPLTLDESCREIVRTAIVDHASIRQWRIWALNVRTNHVHVVVDAGEYRPEIVIGQFKQWSTRRLREANVRDAERVWTREGSTRYLFDSDALQSAIRYVLEGQGGDI